MHDFLFSENVLKMVFLIQGNRKLCLVLRPIFNTFSKLVNLSPYKFILTGTSRGFLLCVTFRENVRGKILDVLTKAINSSMGTEGGEGGATVISLGEEVKSIFPWFG